MDTLRHAPETPDPETGLEEAYQRYRAELRRFFELNSRDPQTVDDLMQTMYLQLIKSRPRDAVREPQGYLFQSAWNLLHTMNRRARTERTRTVPCELDKFDAHADRSNRLWVEDDTSEARHQDEMNRALSELPRNCQIALLRQYRDNKSYKEIAEELGVTTHAVKKYIVRALNHFRQHFNEMDQTRDKGRTKP